MAFRPESAPSAQKSSTKQISLASPTAARVQRTEPVDSTTKQRMDADERKALMEANEARRRAMAISLIVRIANGSPSSLLISAKAEIAKTYIVFRCWITDQDTPA